MPVVSVRAHTARCSRAKTSAFVTPRCQIGEHGTRETKANALAVCTADMLPFRDAHFNDILRRQGDAKHAR